MNTGPKHDISVSRALFHSAAHEYEQAEAEEDKRCALLLMKGALLNTTETLFQNGEVTRVAGLEILHEQLSALMGEKTVH